MIQPKFVFCLCLGEGSSEKELTETNNSSFQNYLHPDDHIRLPIDCPGCKPFTIWLHSVGKVTAVCFLFTVSLTLVTLLLTYVCVLSGISLMAASQSEEIDVLWGISPDPFPFQSPLKEMQVITSSHLLPNLFNLTFCTSVISLAVMLYALETNSAKYST